MGSLVSTMNSVGSPDGGRGRGPGGLLPGLVRVGGGLQRAAPGRVLRALAARLHVLVLAVRAIRVAIAEPPLQNTPTSTTAVNKKMNIENSPAKKRIEIIL